MKKVLAVGEWLGGVLRGSRAVYAVAPLFVPLIFATVSSKEPPVAAKPQKPIELRPIVYASTPKPEPLPAHSICVKVGVGDTLETLFAAAGLAPREAALLARQFAAGVDPRSLRPGQELRVQIGQNDRIEALDLKINGWGTVAARRNGEAFEVAAQPGEEKNEEIVVSAEIDSSLYEAVKKSGETAGLVAQLVDVFQWDVDFFRLQHGDGFSLVVEKRFVAGDHIGYGPILAAQFRHNGQTYEAFRFEHNGLAGYYGRNGAPTRKQFLRAPLKFSRVTSGFTKRRFHPVLNRFRPHYGVDYGAPVGTPVMTTADGVVTFAGYDRGEGNYITVRHNSQTESSYLHLSRFAKGVRKGAKVKQGDVIGYVGSTGLATGPHLDYRVRERGKWVDPRSLKSITADPLHGEALRRFKATVSARADELARATEVAANPPAPSRALF